MTAPFSPNDGRRFLNMSVGTLAIVASLAIGLVIVCCCGFPLLSVVDSVPTD